MNTNGAEECKEELPAVPPLISVFTKEPAIAILSLYSFLPSEFFPPSSPIFSRTERDRCSSTAAREPEESICQSTPRP